MTFKPMFFKGQRVFVDMDDDGTPLLENGRAIMKYKKTDDRIYRPAVANLTTNQEPKSPASMRAASPSSTRPLVADRARMPTDTSTADTIVVYTDGGCIGNPGPSGVGYVIRFPDGTTIAKGEPLGAATNNIAELVAIDRALAHIADGDAPVLLHTDSTYAIGVLTRGWKAKANPELVTDIKRNMSRFSRLQLIKVKGHAGIADNETVDRLANTAARTQQTQSADPLSSNH